MSIVAWRASREERRQSADPGPAQAPSLFATASREPVEPRLGLALALGAFIIATGAAAALVFSHGSQSPTTAARSKGAPRAIPDQRVEQPGRAGSASAPLELVALDHEHNGETLTVRGVIRNPGTGAEMRRLTAVVSVFDRNGGYLASGRAVVDSLTLVPGGQSAFAVSIVCPNVGRYRVSFQADDQPVLHVDKRPPPPVPAIGMNQDGLAVRGIAVGRAVPPRGLRSESICRRRRSPPVLKRRSPLILKRGPRRAPRHRLRRALSRPLSSRLLKLLKDRRSSKARRPRRSRRSPRVPKPPGKPRDSGSRAASSSST